MGKTPSRPPTATAGRAPPKRPASAKAATKPRALTDTEAVRIAAERLAGAIRRGSVATAEKLLARDFSFIDAAGKVHSRRAVLGNLKPGSRSAGAAVRVNAYGRLAVVTGTARSAQAGRNDDLFAIDVWIKGNDGWRALIHHNNVLAGRSTPLAHPPSTPRPAGAEAPACKNPLEFVPYQPKLQAEHDIIAAFQALEQAVTRNDAAAWVQHVADEFVVYRTGSIRPPRH
ncbi:MAG: hypothetical protein QOI12_1304 [Alphaproteobacteria bacterium]|nr:hypothetical protein [Alphaproteobacteria bacterium]